MALLITVPVFGQHEYTHALVDDLEREGAEYLIVDNGGDYSAIRHERIVRPRGNLGWAGGSDLGFRIAFSEGFSHAMTLNNDTRLSRGFVAALLDSRLPANTGIVGPTIDNGFPCAQADPAPAARDYAPRAFYRIVPAVEGTALMISRECWRTIGGLDLRSFGRWGWGIDLDLALRARGAEYGIYTTEMAYINHFGRKTADARFGSRRYELRANLGTISGMSKLYGLRTTLAMDRALKAAPQSQALN